MILADFCYDLPPELIAQNPLSQRHDSRLLLADARSSSFIYSDSAFINLFNDILGRYPVHSSGAAQGLSPDPEGSRNPCPMRVLFVVNDSKVLPARLRLQRKSGAAVEVFLLEPHSAARRQTCLLRPAKKLNEGEALYDPNGIPLVRVFKSPAPHVEPFDPSSLSLSELASRFGQVPLPPYISRDAHVADQERYQTVYAQVPGSVAAPTAGLHFTPDLMNQWTQNGAVFTSVTLHVGLGTFQPVQVQSIDDHNMHEEHYCVPKQTMDLIAKAQALRVPIICVGTTALRTLESFALRKAQGLECHPHTWYATRLFVRPSSSQDRFIPRLSHGLVTNFHQPESSLVMLVAALLGYDNWRNLYAHAIKQRYRFFSYGDASVLLYANP